MAFSGLGGLVWVHRQIDTEVPKPLYSDKEVIAYVRQCNDHQTPMMLNLGIYQDCTIAEASVEQLRQLDTALKGAGVLPKTKV